MGHKCDKDKDCGVSHWLILEKSHRLTGSTEPRQLPTQNQSLVFSMSNTWTSLEMLSKRRTTLISELLVIPEASGQIQPSIGLVRTLSKHPPSF